MKNKIILITGGNSGIGKATAIGLAKLGATVVIACRNKEKGMQAVADIKKASGNQNVELLLMDLASQRSVRAAAEEFRSQFKQLHILINNAAVFLKNREVTEDGLEKTFETNYLSHFLLTHLLLDLLKASAPSRIINVGSKHFGIKINFDDLQTTKNYSFMKAVGPTKLGMILFSKKLSKELQGTGVTVNSLHPGLAKSNLLNDMSGMVRFIFNLMMTSAEKCAETSIYLASSPEVEKVSGKYFEKCKEVPTEKNADSEEDINKLWNASMKLAELEK
jgi:NAD(P)-dependent dehydrogenase (short-subunit alcohol dehydrogenase family)